MKDMSIFVISYEGAHDYIYKSPVAMQIVNEISCRASISKITDKKKIKYDLALKQREVKQFLLCEERLLSQALLQAAEKAFLHENYDSFNSYYAPSHQKKQNSERHLKEKANKLFNIFGSTEQQRIESEIMK